MKPIIFSTPMVKAILEGRKTMTRRIIKPQPTNPRWNNIGFLGWDDGHGYEIKCPYGKPSDILWVRETWLQGDDGYHYKANATPTSEEVRKSYGYKWHPSIHMPQTAARIFLKITDLRVERLQYITEEDAFKEGISIDEVLAIPASISARNLFEGLWDSLNARRGHGWETNPWVWVIEFERCKGSI